MKKIKTVLMVFTTVLASALVFAGGTKESSSKDTAGGAKEIYFLNFKPEIADVYTEIAKEYEAETGVKVNVMTAASGTYEQTLRSEIVKSNPPTIFQVNGPVGYQRWKDYCADLKNTAFYRHLMDKSLSITDGDGVFGIPYVVEGYGIIYNAAIMKQYFALSDKGVSLSSVADINSFQTLKSVVEDMMKHKDELGIAGVFASTSLATGEDWRWQTHLLNMPLYYEWKDASPSQSAIATGVKAKTIGFKYGSAYKNIFDLYLNNSVTPKALVGSKSVDDSMAEFAMGRAAMVQNGNWAWSQIAGFKGNKVTADDIRFLPIYIGASGEEHQGLCIGTENYFCINAKVSAAKQKASEDFLNWLYTSVKGKDFVTNRLGFIAPFDSFSDNERPNDPLAREVTRWMGKKGVHTVEWAFEAFPSQDFKNSVGGALLEYAQGQKSWDSVEKLVVDEWKTEKAKSVE